MMSAAQQKVALTNAVLSSLAVAQVHREHSKNIVALDFDSSGKYCLSVGEDEALNVYDCELGRHMKVCNSKKYGVDLVRYVNRSHNNVIYASTKVDDALRLMSLHDNKYIRYFKGHTSRVTSLDTNPVNDYVISGSVHDGVRLWDLRSPNCQGTMQISSRTLVAFDPQGLVFAVAKNSDTILLYDVASFDKGPFAVFEDLTHKDWPNATWTSLMFSADGNSILIGTDQNVLFLADAFKGKPLLTLTGHTNPTRSRLLPTFTPDAQSVISGSSDGTVHIWNAATRNNVAVLKGHTGTCHVVRFNPSYAMMATAHSELAFWLPADENGLLFDDLA